MPDFQTFTCRKCNGTGGVGPIRPSTGRPFVECIYCEGVGEIERSVDNMWDRHGRMAAVSAGAKGTAINREGEKIADKSRAEWDRVWNALGGVHTIRARCIKCDTVFGSEPESYPAYHPGACGGYIVPVRKS